MNTAALRARSAAVFGNRHRAELLAALAAAGERGVCLGELAASLGMPASVYHAQMRALLEQGLVEKLPVVIGDRRRYYRRCGDAALWGALAAAVAALNTGASGPGAVGGTNSRGRVLRGQATRAR